jgi:hypothetical protein
MSVVDPKYTKAVASTLTVQTEERDVKDVFGGDLKFTLCDRDLISNNKGSYFVSFNLPTQTSDLDTGSTLSKFYPELQQMNVDRIIISPIPPASYSEFIDGRTITFRVPQHGGLNQGAMSAVTLYSSTYTSDKILISETSPLLGNNVAFLFSDDINRPYTGLTINEIGVTTSNAANTSWNPNPTNFTKRPSAVQYLEVKRYLDTFNVATDTRANINYSVNVGSSYPDNRPGYNYDIPCGFIVLDKGYMVLTHSAITSNFPWNSGFTNAGAYVDDLQISGKTNIFFTGVTTNADPAAELIFEDINTSFKTTAVCLALPKEFYISNNPTWNREQAIAAMDAQNPIISFDPVFISEVGMYNALGELVSVAKLSEPYRKSYTSVFNFTIDIEM